MNHKAQLDGAVPRREKVEGSRPTYATILD